MLLLKITIESSIDFSVLKASDRNQIQFPEDRKNHLQKSDPSHLGKLLILKLNSSDRNNIVVLCGWCSELFKWVNILGSNLSKQCLVLLLARIKFLSTAPGECVSRNALSS